MRRKPAPNRTPRGTSVHIVRATDHISTVVQRKLRWGYSRRTSKRLFPNRRLVILAWELHAIAHTKEKRLHACWNRPGHICWQRHQCLKQPLLRVRYPSGFVAQKGEGTFARTCFVPLDVRPALAKFWRIRELNYNHSLRINICGHDCRSSKRRD
jgi:hypothetical protein